ncbi:hypothetical protein [Eubacterium ramulus]
MKKLKQITALIGVIALAGLYVSTLVLALIGSEQCINLLKAAVYATIVLPVLLWAYSFIYRLIKKDQTHSMPSEKSGSADIKEKGKKAD